MNISNIFLLLFQCLICLMITGCAPNLKTDMSNYVLQVSGDVRPMTDALVVDASEVRFSHRKTGNTAIAGNTGHNMAGLHYQYAQHVNSALFGMSTSKGNAKKAVLVLESIAMVQIVGEGFANFDISEQVTALWTLYNVDKNKRLFSLEVSGSAAGKVGWGDAIAENARDRMGRAYQNMLDNTLREFVNSEDLQRFSLLSGIYLNPTQSVSIAKQILMDHPASEYPRLLEGMRSASVVLNEPSLYDFSRHQIQQHRLDAIKDESSLLNLAIASPQFDDERVKSIINHSTELNSYNDEGMTPLEISLAFGRDGVAVALVSAGAKPTVGYAGNVYVSAEIAYRLANLLVEASTPADGVARSAIKQYEQAIYEFKYAIESNEASIYAKKIMKVLGPMVQYTAASAEATYEARQSAKTSPYGQGFGYAEFTLQRYDTNIPAQANQGLRGLIEQCEARIIELMKLL